MSPETGNEFGTDDVVGGSSALFTHGFCVLQSENLSAKLLFPLISLQLCLIVTIRFHLRHPFQATNSLVAIHRKKWRYLGQVQPYADEPPAHTSDEEEDAEKDQDGLSPAVLRSRLEREVPLNEWRVFSFILPMNPSLHQLEAMDFVSSHLAGTIF